MKYYIIAGEAKRRPWKQPHQRIKKLDTNAAVRCWGGDKMQTAGGELVKTLPETCFHGFCRSGHEPPHHLSQPEILQRRYTRNTNRMYWCLLTIPIQSSYCQMGKATGNERWFIYLTRYGHGKKAGWRWWKNALTKCWSFFLWKKII